MSMSDKKRTSEKERLWNEVMNKKRIVNDEVNLQNVSLENPIQEEKKSTDTFQNTMIYADEMLHALKDVLNKQKSDLEKLYRKEPEVKEIPPVMSIEEMEQEIQKEYGIQAEESVKEQKEIDIQLAFEHIRQQVDEVIVGQNEAIDAMCAAFKRPHVMGQSDEASAKNVIIVCGPNGSGKHALVSAMANALQQEELATNNDVYTMDMSLYQSAAQEQVFIQDLYRNLNQSASIVVFENFASAAPSFIRMLDSLVCSGKVVLNKRYVDNKGILVENQTGLVKEAIDALTANHKYLVFITEDLRKVQDTFGADFLGHVLDIVSLKSFSAEDISELIHKKLFQFKVQVQNQLHMDITYTDDVNTWVEAHFDKTKGADGIVDLINDFYVCLGQAVLNQHPETGTLFQIVIEENRPYAVLKDQKILLARQKNRQEEIDQVNGELEQVVGLHAVKDYIYSLQSHIRMQELRRQQGMKVTELSKHMIFTGNPGTGKTTIARLISRYMKAIGALSKGQLVEVTRADLVAQYVGQTAPLTMSVIKSALGGVLFIDEAYSLYRGKDDSFGLECIDTIVKAMEDYRSDLIVILAGYKKEMSEFLEANSGLRSRFPNMINFPDYTKEELLQIAKFQAKGKGYQIAEEVELPLQEYFGQVQSNNAEEAGNGRLARNVVEAAILQQSNRLMKDSDAKLDELKLEDFAPLQIEK